MATEDVEAAITTMYHAIADLDRARDTLRLAQRFNVLVPFERNIVRDIERDLDLHQGSLRVVIQELRTELD